MGNFLSYIMGGLKRFSLIKENHLKIVSLQNLCEACTSKEALYTSPYCPETNGPCEHFNATLINMLGTLHTHGKKNWQECLATLSHAYDLHCFFCNWIQSLSPGCLVVLQDFL